MAQVYFVLTQRLALGATAIIVWVSKTLLISYGWMRERLEVLLLIQIWVFVRATLDGVYLYTSGYLGKINLTILV